MKKLSNYPIIQLSNYPIIQFIKQIFTFLIFLVFSFSSKSASMIVGGSTGNISQKSIVYIKDNSTASRRAAGTIISDCWILTSAKFVTSTASTTQGQIDLLRIIAGVNDPNNLSASGRQEVSIAQIIIHPNFNPNSLDNDICLLRLNTCLNANNCNVMPNFYATQAEAGLITVNQNVQINGWGNTTSSPNNFSPILLEANMKIVSANASNNTFEINKIDGIDKCGWYGDEGGPVLLNIPNIGNLVVGIIRSFGPLFVTGANTVCLNISNYASWIESNTQVRRPTLSGPDYFCTSSQYQVNNLQAGMTFNTSLSNGLLTKSGTNPFTLTKVNNGVTDLTVTISRSNCINYTLTKRISVGIVGVTNINVNENPPYCRDRSGSVPCPIWSVVSPVSYVTYEWQLNGANRGTGSTKDICTTALPVGTHTVRVRSYNSCGTTNWYAETFNVINCTGGPRSTALRAVPTSENQLTIFSTDEAGVDDISYTQSKNYRVAITDKYGNKKQDIWLENKTIPFTFDISNLAQDVYIVNIATDSTLSTLKFVK